MTRRSSRRNFLKTSALASVGLWAAGGVSLAESKSANEKLNVAVIGAGGQGGGNLRNVAAQGANIVALCDPDEERAKDAYRDFPKAKRFHDYRKMFDEIAKEIDAVTVSTPDHNHAPASVMAMKLGKHVYCEKPLTHTVYEARVMRETAAKMKVATQMGNQGTSTDGLRRAAEVVQAGALGTVQEAHVWTNRPIWPQGADAILRHQGARAAAFAALHGKTVKLPKPTIRPTLDWDVWLGPAADRPYDSVYLPFSWRGWWDFGTGALGDMACHTANLAFMALQLKYPEAVVAETVVGLNPDSCPEGARVRYDFPGSGDKKPIKMYWYEGRQNGQLLQPPPSVLKNYKQPEKGYTVLFRNGLVMARNNDGKERHVESGCFIVGDKAVLFSPSDYGGESFLLTDGGIQRITGKPEKMPSSPGHHKEWIEACKGGPAAVSNFGYAGLLTETVLLGNVAIRAGQGKKVAWNGDKLTTGKGDTDALLRMDYRKGWTL